MKRIHFVILAQLLCLSACQNPPIQPLLGLENSPMVTKSTAPKGYQIQQNQPALAPMSITLNNLNATGLVKGKTTQWRAQVNYSDFSADKNLTWEVDDPQLASINSEGEISALQAGQVTITARAQADPTISASATLTVENPVVYFGGHIVYIANNDLYLLQENNLSPLRLTEDGETQDKLWPRLAWDGSAVVYTSSARDVFTLETSGTDTPTHQNLTPNGTDPLPIIYADGQLVFQGYGGIFPTSYLGYMRLPNGTTFPISSAAGKIDFLGGVDYNGLIVYTVDGEVFTVPYDNGAAKVNYGAGITPSISKTHFADRFVFVDAGQLKIRRYTGELLHSLSIPGITPQNPALSPDQSQVIFMSDHEGNQDLYLINLNGSGLVNLTNSPNINEDMPDWSL